MNAPSIAEQIATVKEIRDMLIRSYTVMCGPTKGQIIEPGVARQLECLAATKLILQREKVRRK